MTARFAETTPDHRIRDARDGLAVLLSDVDGDRRHLDRMRDAGTSGGLAYFSHETVILKFHAPSEAEMRDDLPVRRGMEPGERLVRIRRASHLARDLLEEAIAVDGERGPPDPILATAAVLLDEGLPDGLVLYPTPWSRPAVWYPDAGLVRAIPAPLAHGAREEVSVSIRQMADRVSVTLGHASDPVPGPDVTARMRLIASQPDEIVRLAEETLRRWAPTLPARSY